MGQFYARTKGGAAMKLQRQLIIWDEGVELAAYSGVECSGVASLRLTDKIGRVLASTGFGQSRDSVAALLEGVVARSTSSENN